MDVKLSDGHDGLQVVEENAIIRRSDDEKQHFPHSDKQVVEEEKALPAQSRLPLKNAYNQGFAAPEKTYRVSEKELCFGEKGNGTMQPDHLTKQRYHSPRSAFCCFVIVLVCSMVVGASIGGGVVGALSNRSKHAPVTPASTGSAVQTTATANTLATTVSNSSDPLNTASVTRTYLSAAPTSTATPNGMGEYDCPGENGTYYKSSLYSQTFEVLCDADWPDGVVGINGGRVVDLNTGVVATSIQACIEQCSANYAGGGGCSAVAYGANITLALSRSGITGNCFMKTQRGATIFVDNSGQAMAAFRVSD